MTVSARKRRIVAALSDLEAGDMVRRVGHRGVGLVESVDQGFAWVAWKEDRKDYLPLCVLRRVRPVGSSFDRRGG